VTPEMRKNQMVMMEEFRRRKNLKDFYKLYMKDRKIDGERSGIAG
jgi:hypothetical protein